ncbi:hypothetical protein MHW47_07775 [Streptomyces sp. OfavH-34-F]|uniref:hypothetical protein n=1 Tax=Streptomyces sp. OfavH-34-F TaxID=2917760 RepID=UPI001EF28772|nr:hypothetical protein [Streptomyces sp. OfavH-34-F]MCG7524334.1 hypothetical protein [Streptomyces sp. OfavH-34-F]
MSSAEAVQTLRLRKLKVLDDHRKEVRKLDSARDSELRKIDQELAELGDASASLPCLVRITPGPDLTVYHSAVATCRRVQRRWNFKNMPEVDAMDASPYTYLERCSACDWRTAAKNHGGQLLEQG